MHFDETFDSGGEVEVLHQRQKIEFAGEALRGARVLDVGCWTGAFESLAVDVAREVTGVDVEPRALEVARREVPGATFVEASVLELPFEPGSFDVVTMWDVIEHIPRGTERKALARIARVLAGGGRLMLSTPSRKPLSILLDPAYFLVGHRHYSEPELAVMLAEAGLRLERSITTGGWLAVANYMSMYFWKYVIRRPRPSWPRFNAAVLRDSSRPGFVTLNVVAVRDSGGGSA